MKGFCAKLWERVSAPTNNLSPQSPRTTTALPRSGGSIGTGIHGCVKRLIKTRPCFGYPFGTGYFSIGFYFTEKTSAGVEYLNIARELKNDLLNAKRIGRLIPLVIKVVDSAQIGDILKIAAYKKNLK